MNTGRASNTGRGSDVIVLIEAGGFYSRKYGKSVAGNQHFYALVMTENDAISLRKTYFLTRYAIHKW